MSSFDAIVLCFGFAIVSLLAVSYVNRNQMRRRLLAQKLEQMKRRIDELEEISAFIEPLIESRPIVIYVLNELVELINKVRRLEPRSHYLEANLSNAEERLDDLHSNRGKKDLWRLQSSDAAIARARYCLNEAGRILRKRQVVGELSAEELHMYIAELSWAHSMVGVTTLIAQGHQAVSRGDVLKAYAFYKSAQQILIHSTQGDERRHQFIKELSEILSNRRKAISLSLMPESDYNPSIDSEKLIIPVEDK